MLSVIALKEIMLGVMLSAVVPNEIMLRVVVLNGIMLSECCYAEYHFAECH